MAHDFGTNLHARRLWLLLLGAVAWLPIAPADAADRVPWVEDLAAAQQMAAASDRLVLLHFFDTNCPPCLRIEKNVFSQRTFAHQLSEKYVPVKLSVSQNPELVRRYHIEAWPTDVIVTPAGQEIFRAVSPQEKTAYLSMLNEVSWRHHSRPHGTSAVAAASAALPPPRDARPASQTSNYQLSSTMLASHQQGSTHDGDAFSAPIDGAAQPSAASSHGWQTELTEAPLQADGATGDVTVRDTPSRPHVVDNPYVRRPPTEQPEHHDANPSVSDDMMSYSPSAAASGTDMLVSPPRAGYHMPSASADLSAVAHLASSNLPRAQSSGDSTATSTGDPTTAGAASTQPPSDRPLKFCLDGHCPVALIEEGRWVAGDRRWGAHHRGRTYLFQSSEAQQKFLAAPDRYSPGLAGYDPVVFAEQGTYREGKREHGVMYNNQMFLFADEQSFERFWADPARYAHLIHQAMGTRETQFR